MIFTITLLFVLVSVGIIISVDLDVILKGILSLPLLCLFFSGAEILKHNQALGWGKRDDYSAKFYLRRHNKYSVKSVLNYVGLVTKAILYLYLFLGFYQWYDKAYSSTFWVILHTIVVAALLLLNLYIDIFEGNWYRGLNINIIKDEFVQRKVITMIGLIVIVCSNAFIVFLF